VTDAEVVEIELLTGVAGDRGDMVQGNPGDLLQVPADVAALWADGIRARRVEPAREPRIASPPVETAVVAPRETAATQGPRSRR
jgi:hypothetical protein